MMFQQLEYFIAVAESGSINKAAESLFISQQALRASINSLEQKLGFRLFERSARGMTITPWGLTVLEDAREIVRMSERWGQYVESGKRITGTVRITASTIVCSSVLTNVVSECRKLYPNLTVALYEAREDELLRRMSSHMIGVLGSVPMQVIEDKIRPFAVEKKLRLEIYARDEFYVFLNARHSLATRKALTSENLLQLSLAIYPNEEKKFFYRKIFEYFNPVTPYYMQRQENIFQLIAENVNVSSVFPHIGQINNHYVDQGRICALPVADFPMPAITCMLMPSLTGMTPAEKVVSEMIRDHISRIPFVQPIE